MDETHMMLKTRLSEVLETLNLIILLYSFFLTIFGVMLHNSEVIVQTCIMYVVYIIFEYINYDIVVITSKGITCEKYGFVDWVDMYRIRRKERIFYIYTKKREKPYKIIIKFEILCMFKCC